MVGRGFPDQPLTCPLNGFSDASRRAIMDP